MVPSLSPRPVSHVELRTLTPRPNLNIKSVCRPRSKGLDPVFFQSRRDCLRYKDKQTNYLTPLSTCLNNVLNTCNTLPLQTPRSQGSGFITRSIGYPLKSRE